MNNSEGTGLLPSRLMTVRETAALLRLNEFTVYRMVASRRLPHIRIGRKVLIDRPRLERWIERRTIGERQLQELSGHYKKGDA